LQDAGLLAFYFHILTTMHGQNHIKLIFYTLLYSRFVDLQTKDNKKTLRK